MPKPRPGWHVWSIREGELPTPTPLSQEGWRRVMSMRREYSGDRNWLTVYDDTGQPAMVLIRLGTKRDESTAYAHTVREPA
jgi:hypothetical protein